MDQHNLSFPQYTERCKRIEADYKHLHQQHLTVFGAFQRLQQASKGLRTSSENVQHALYSSVDDKELERMLDEQQQIMNKLRLIEKENEGLMGSVDPMTADDYPEKRKYDPSDYNRIQTAGGTSKPNNPSATHPRLSRLPPYDGYHESHVAPYKKACGGVVLSSTYLNEIADWAPQFFRDHPFTSFYGYINALIDYKHPLPKGKFTEAANHNPTLYYPFRRMLSEIVGNVRWCDYVFHHRIPGMFKIKEMEDLSKMKADVYNPCLKVTVEGVEAVNTKKKWDTLFKADYEDHNHTTRVVFPDLSPKVQYPDLSSEVQYPDLSPEVQYFLPAYELYGKTLTLIFHVARGGEGIELKQLPPKDDLLNYQVFVNSTFHTKDKMTCATMEELRDTQNSNRETFRKYALSHDQSEMPPVSATMIVKTCLEEYNMLRGTLNKIWDVGYTRLHAAVNDVDARPHLTELLKVVISRA